MNVIYVSETKWHKYWFRYDLLWELGKLGHTVSYVAPQRWMDYIQNLAFINRSPNPGANIIKFRPYLRISKKLIAQELNNILHIIEDLLIKETVVISNLFTYCSAIKDHFGSKVKVVYDIYDRYSEYGNELYNKDPLAIQQFDNFEIKAIAKCDVVMCASKTLLAEAFEINRSAVWFPNGIPERHIITSSKTKFSTKTIGMISDRLSRIDPHILSEIADGLPDFRIELVGRNDLDSRRVYPRNVIFFDFMLHNEMLKHITKWDYGLAIYKEDRFNHYCCPMKYFEYSARNVPVITSPIPVVKEFADHYPDVLYLAENGQQFVQRIKECSVQTKENDFTRLAKENTWKIRAGQLSGYLAMVSM